MQVPVSQVPVFLLFIYLHLKSCLSACLSSTYLLSFGQCIRVAVHLHVIFIDCLIACLSFCFSVSLPDSLFVCLYLCIIVYVFIIFYENIFHICASLFMFVFMPVCLKGYLYLSPCDNLSVNLSVYVTICFSFCLSDCLPVYLSRCLSISLFVFSACKLVSLFVFYASVTVFLSAFFLCSWWSSCLFGRKSFACEWFCLFPCPCQFLSKCRSLCLVNCSLFFFLLFLCFFCCCCCFMFLYFRLY